MKYLIITENDESQWDAKTDEYYHFPSKYRNKLIKGSKIIYYKGKRKNKNFIRLSDDPHYFGIAVIGTIEKNLTENSKNSFYASIENYQPFISAVSFKDTNGNYLENVISKNHFRDGVRLINEEVYFKILSDADVLENQSKENASESLSSWY